MARSFKTIIKEYAVLFLVVYFMGAFFSVKIASWLWAWGACFGAVMVYYSYNHNQVHARIRQLTSAISKYLIQPILRFNKKYLAPLVEKVAVVYMVIIFGSIFLAVVYGFMVLVTNIIAAGVEQFILFL